MRRLRVGAVGRFVGERTILRTTLKIFGSSVTPCANFSYAVHETKKENSLLTPFQNVARVVEKGNYIEALFFQLTMREPSSSGMKPTFERRQKSVLHFLYMAPATSHTFTPYTIQKTRRLFCYLQAVKQLALSAFRKGKNEGSFFIFETPGRTPLQSCALSPPQFLHH